MGNHRLERQPGRRVAPPPGRRRAGKATPRYGRLAVLGASLSVTAVAMLGGVGVLPNVASGDPGGDTVRDTSTASDSLLAASEASPTPSAAPAPDPASAPAATSEPGKTKQKQKSEPAGDLAVPSDSGAGRRVVFDQSAQRVWLVDDGEEVERTYLVSGSVTDNLQPGSYDVYSRSEDAVGIDDSGTMKYFVRFTQGPSGAAIGFHDIPVDNGALVQTAGQLGTPQSHGCVRQEREDAIALWDFAPLGTDVEVVA